jgi:hypothetical protein
MMLPSTSQDDPLQGVQRCEVPGPIGDTKGLGEVALKHHCPEDSADFTFNSRLEQRIHDEDPVLFVPPFA